MASARIIAPILNAAFASPGVALCGCTCFCRWRARETRCSDASSSMSRSASSGGIASMDTAASLGASLRGGLSADAYARIQKQLCHLCQQPSAAAHTVEALAQDLLQVRDPNQSVAVHFFLLASPACLRSACFNIRRCGCYLVLAPAGGVGSSAGRRSYHGFMRHVRTLGDGCPCGSEP